jgi:hypothetical protein
MKRKRIRCYERFIDPIAGVYNIKIFDVVYEGFSNCKLYICRSCGELFVIDWDNPQTKHRSYPEMCGILECPACRNLLSVTLFPYPENIRLHSGRIVRRNLANGIPPDNETIIRDFYEIEPGL